MLYFSFNERPQEMFDRVVEVKVLNAKKVIRDALIGSFKVGLSGPQLRSSATNCIAYYSY